ncbi:hypothetical protein AGLY_010455 [Aphis glycines]|uniref:Uncharacterized protein n=1 Tax=Aphis glycines TaxID=307491 RepID=A0A6G0TDL2_APHGL|nr:hypothetical protein AGLY_010455 [Aphis glycines]
MHSSSFCLMYTLCIVLSRQTCVQKSSFDDLFSKPAIFQQKLSDTNCFPFIVNPPIASKYLLDPIYLDHQVFLIFYKTLAQQSNDNRFYQTLCNFQHQMFLHLFFYQSQKQPIYNVTSCIQTCEFRYSVNSAADILQHQNYNPGVFMLFNVLLSLKTYYVLLHEIEPQKLTLEVLNLVKPKTYKIVLGTQRTTEIIRDNLGFLYYKNKKTENKIIKIGLVTGKLKPSTIRYNKIKKPHRWSERNDNDLLSLFEEHMTDDDNRSRRVSSSSSRKSNGMTNTPPSASIKRLRKPVNRFGDIVDLNEITLDCLDSSEKIRVAIRPDFAGTLPVFTTQSRYFSTPSRDMDIYRFLKISLEFIVVTKNK